MWQRRSLSRFAAVTALVVLSLVWGADHPVGAAFPEPRGAVNDYAELLSAGERGQLEAISQELLDKTGAALVVAVMATLGDADVADYATDLFAAWGIGQSGDDNGVLLLLALEEREVAIEVGYGLEETLTDARSGHILRELILPAFREGNFYAGLDKGMRAMATVIASQYEVTLEESGGYSLVELDGRTVGYQRDIIGIAVLLALGIGLIALGTGKFGPRCPRCKERLLVTQRIIKKATAFAGGLAGKTYTCRRCGYRDEKTHHTPPLGRHTAWGGPTMGGRGGSFGGGSRGGGFGGFGGGRSGGGGARGRF